MIETTCKHYNGLLRNTVCEQQVSYSKVTIPGTGPVMDRMPCFGRCPDAYCASREFPTPEEIAAEEAEFAELFARSHTAREAILKHAGGKRGIVGRLPCPVCEKGELRYSVAACNGHIHAGCTTEDCVRFME